MTKAAIYTRSSSGNGDCQREELIAKFGHEYEIIAEYSDDATDTSGFEKLLEDAAKGKFDVLLCTDLTRLTRQLSSEILAALKKAGVRVVTADGDEISFADLVANTFKPKTFVEDLGERIKRGKRAARERRKSESAAQSNDGSQ